MLKAGDIVNIDVTVIKDGFHGDTSRMFYVGTPTIQAKRLCEVTYAAMWRGIREVKPGANLGDIGATIQRYAEGHGFSVVREFCGHGIGRQFHEEPQVLHYGKAGTGMKLQPGMIFTIEPMINAGRAGIRGLADGWTIVTADHSLSAQWEHTVLVTRAGLRGADALRRRAAPAARGRGLNTGAVAATLATACRSAAGATATALEARSGAGPRDDSRRLCQGPYAASPAAAQSQLVDRVLRGHLDRHRRTRRRRTRRRRRIRTRPALPPLGRRCTRPVAADAWRTAAAEGAIERFIGLLWDTGLEVAHSVRTIDECETEMAGDITIRTSLLEHRLLDGSRALYDRFRRRFAATLDARGFYEAKVLEQQQRHLRYQDTAYNLEPNVKESPGGLRDLQTIVWIARAAGLGRTWRELAARGSDDSPRGARSRRATNG